MALVRASQSFIMVGSSEVKVKKHWWSKAEYQRQEIRLSTWVEAICDETEAAQIIEEKIKEEMKTSSGWGRNFTGWTSYRKYYNPGEIFEYPDGRVCDLNIQYIRDWKMERVVKELNGKQFAIFCQELGCSIAEAIKNS